jgi:chemotaxis protein methyltransferase CheR
MLASADQPLSQADFDRVRRMIKARAGIHLQPSKQSMVQGRLARQVRDHGFSGFGPYLDALERADSPLWQPFVNALTTNLTSFFREAYHFPVLAEFLAGHRGGPVRLWCAAASTGEEPWSIAMTALETLGEHAPVSILATDIDTGVLQTARAGVYPAAGDKGLDPGRLRRWFLRGTGPNAGLMRVRAELARHVEFAQLNLVDVPYRFHEPFDAVFCRNVMIYFDDAVRMRLLDESHRLLKPGGLLFVGHAESLAGMISDFKYVRPSIYRKA